jgi:hypothetical protein
MLILKGMQSSGQGPSISVKKMPSRTLQIKVKSRGQGRLSVMIKGLLGRSNTLWQELIIEGREYSTAVENITTGMCSS